jgi:hypothetical protein
MAGAAAAQTPPPAPLTMTLTVTTGADGTNDTPVFSVKDVNGEVLGVAALDQMGDLQPGATDIYSFTISADFCAVTGFELTKPAAGADDAWELQRLTLLVDGTEVWVSDALSAPLTAGVSAGGAWQATPAYRDRCGALAWTPVAVRVVTAGDGTADDLRLELGGSFPNPPYVQTLSQPNDLQPEATDVYSFIVPMEFCEIRSFRLLKPSSGAEDDSWAVEEIGVTIDGVDVFFDRAAEAFNPITAASFPPNGDWSGTTAYAERCGGEASVPLATTVPTMAATLPLLPATLLSPDIVPSVMSPTPSPTPDETEAVTERATAESTEATAEATESETEEARPTATRPPASAAPTAAATLIPPPPGATTCPGFLTSRLVVGGTGRVTPGLPNNLRAAPDSASERLARIPGGAGFRVLSGPQCDPAGIAWWQVEYNGVTGWTAEGQGGEYWVEPTG